MVRSARPGYRSANRSHEHHPELEHLETRLPPGSLLLTGSPTALARPTAAMVSSATSADFDFTDEPIELVSFTNDNATRPQPYVGDTTGESSTSGKQSATADFTNSCNTAVARTAVSTFQTLATRASSGQITTAPSSPGIAASGIAGVAAAGFAGFHRPAAGQDAGVSVEDPNAAGVKLPIYFEANKGQTDARVDYIARGQGYTLFLTSTEAVFHLQQNADSAAAVLRMELEGGNAAAVPLQQQRLQGTVNYFIGNDTSEWVAGIPTFGRVEYAGVYPGVNMVYYGKGSDLEYDFIVAPGADPAAISLNMNGADGLEIEADGDLLVHTAAGALVQQKPMVYQESAEGRQEIASRYTVNGTRVGFALGDYDASRPLVIDPVVYGYSTYMGGDAADQGFGIAVSHTGSAFITGRTGSANFPTTPGVIQPSHSAGNDAFVARFTPDGTGLVYATYLGGSLDDVGQSIVVDRQHNAYVTGATGSSNFPVTAGAFQTTNGGSTDAFVAELAADGASMIYATYLGGSGVDQGFGIAVNRFTHVAYVGGGTTSPNFPTTAGAFQSTHGGDSDAFITSVNATGTALGYSTYLGGADVDRANAIALDGQNRAVIVGQTKSTNFPTTAGALQTTYGGGAFDAFMARFFANGTIGVSTYIGTAGEDHAEGVAVSGVGQTYITGRTASNAFPVTAGAFQTTYGGGAFDAYVMSMPLNGQSITFASYLGGTGEDRGNAIAIDSGGRAYVSGNAGNATYPVTAGALQTTFGGGTNDAFFTQFAPNGASLLYSTLHGGAAVDLGEGIAIDRLGNVYMTGNTLSSNLPVTAGTFQAAKSGSNDGYVVKYTVSTGRSVTPRGLIRAQTQTAPGG
jgi:hypothetical protein